MPKLTAIRNKLKEIYDDLATNVTYIHGRPELHFAIDLVYHSPLRIIFDSKEPKKAYLDVLVIGDTRTGKTQCAEALMHHYGCGATAQSESMSIAGLVGGLQKMFDKQWDVTWGKLPQNNRRLLIIDEASAAADKEIIGSLSSIRSSGVASLDKIASQKTEARTRLLWLSNPRGRLTVGQFSSGVEVVESLCEQPEDIARWDFAIIVAKDDVDIHALRKSRVHEVPHKYTSKLCRSLVLWSWTRDPNEIHISKKVVDKCFELAEKMSTKYSSEFMLVTDAEQPLKLCRLATALAARLFNTPDGVNLIVETEHVEYIYEYLNHIYDAKHFGYNIWSENRNEGQEILDKDMIHAFMNRIGKPGCMKFLQLKRMKLKDISEYLGLPDDEAKVILSQLLMNNALERHYGDFYRKSRDFNSMLRARISEYNAGRKDAPDKDGL